MPTLSPQEIQQVYMACELLEEYYLNEPEGCYPRDYYSETVFLPPYYYLKWLNFYRPNFDNMPRDYSSDKETRKNERIMALLFFVAAGGEL